LGQGLKLWGALLGLGGLGDDHRRAVVQPGVLLLLLARCQPESVAACDSHQTQANKQKREDVIMGR
jgi:hypothetical protein